MRRRGHRSVVFGPNTAIQAQWRDTWRDYPEPIQVGTERAAVDSDAPVVALTYQSLATFDPEADDDTRSMIDRLHPNGAELVEALRAAGPVTIVLDECHHLLETWGRLMAELLDLLPDAFVLALTATPPEVLSPDQQELVEGMFGTISYAASIPAAVREGTLAPFAEMAWLTAPTAAESQWLAERSERFTRLITDLTSTQYGSVPLLVWLDRRVTELPAGWAGFHRQNPELASAVLTLAHAGMVSTPRDARMREQHRQPPSADDWVEVIEDWVQHCLRASDDPHDAAVVDAVGRALPSVGYQLSTTGIRRGRSPVDRVLARSAAKATACTQIVQREALALAERLRLLVLCDHEHTSATAPSGLDEDQRHSAGSARLMLSTLIASAETAALHPVLVTGQTVAAAPGTAAVLLERLRDKGVHRVDELRLTPWPDDTGVVSVEGPWSSKDWVEQVTRFFEDGDSQVLIGTRALLGEGWDARGLNALVDLTTATTTSAVVQTRGRALRTDPHWADKVALTWTVVCVTEDHPRGHTDWDRFVRKHTGYYGVDDTGEVVSGVAHVDPAFSPYAPPPAAEFGSINTHTIARADDRPSIAELWNVGAPYTDQVSHTLRVRQRRTAAADEQAGATSGVPAAPAVLLGPSGPRRAADSAVPRAHPWRAVRVVREEPDLARFAATVADAMHSAQLSSVASDGLRVRTEPNGETRLVLARVSEEVSRVFAESLDELVSPPAAPRYVVPRYTLDPAGSATVAGWRDRKSTRLNSSHVAT